jgi:hypothetical protein
MAITTLDGLIAASRQRAVLKKTTTRATIANGWFSMFDIAGNPGAGTLAIGNTANGLAHTDATAGYPTITTFGGGNTGYLSRAEIFNSVISRIRVFDRVFSCGAYAFNANTTLSSQPSFLERIPGGIAAATAGCTEIWVETVTSTTGNQTWNVTYTNDAGTDSRTTGAVGIAAAPTVGRCWQLPLQAGDKGVSLITKVQGGTATVGTGNIHVLRPLYDIRIPVANYGEVIDFARLGLPIIYDTSALFFVVMADSTSSGVPDMQFDISNG